MPQPLLFVRRSAFAQSDARSKQTKRLSVVTTRQPTEYVALYAKIKSDVALKAYCAFQAGESYRLHHEPEMATEWYDKAIGLKYGDRNSMVFWCTGTRSVTRKHLMRPSRCTHVTKMREAILTWPKAALKTPTSQPSIEEPESRYIVEPMVLLNSASYDFCPTFTGKKQDELVFASSRESATERTKIPSRAKLTWTCSTATWTRRGVGVGRAFGQHHLHRAQ